MALATFFVNDATTHKPIQQLEHSLNQLEGIERVLVDTTDGEVKVEYDSNVITKEQIIQMLYQLD